MKDLTIVLIIILIVLILFKNNREYLVSKPKAHMIPTMTQEIIQNEGMFTSGIEPVKKKIPWMDPVLYEDVRNLSFKKNINTDTVSRLLK